MDCELYQCVTYFKLSPNALRERMLASGWLAICLLLLSVSISSYFEFCLLLGGNRDVLVPVNLGFEASPSSSSGFTQAFGFLW